MIIFSFLLGALILTFLVSPKSKKQIWILSTCTPIVAVFLYSALKAITNTSTIASSYIVRQACEQTLIPAILSGICIFFILKRKLLGKTAKVLYIIFSVLAILGLGIDIYNCVLRYTIMQYLSAG